MSSEQATALIIAISGLVAAVGAVFAQVRQTHAMVNGRLTQLLENTKLAGQKTGELEGRDHERQATEAGAPATPPEPPTS